LQLKLRSEEVGRVTGQSKDETVSPVEQRLQLAMLIGRVATWDLDLSTGRNVWSDSHFSLLGFDPTPDRLATAEMWQSAIVPEDLPLVLQRWQAAERERRDFESEHRFRHRTSGNIVWVKALGRFSFDDAGRATRFVGASIDITAEKQRAEQQLLLLQELNHRLKNTLAIVQAMAKHTFQGAGWSERGNEFASRVQALSRVHDVLTAAAWVSTDVAAVVQSTLAHCSAAQLTFEGDARPLTPKQALALSLVLYELSSNAAKYGALSTPEGAVSVTWRRRVVAKHFELKVRWEETGGPKVKAPTRTGFGSRLLRTIVENDLSGELKLEYAPDGAVCDLAFPVQDSAEPD